MQRTKKLVGLDVIETSGVDRAAHLYDGFLVMKSANETNRVKALLLKALGKSKEDNLSSVQEQIDHAIKKTVDDYVEKVAELESALEAAKNQCVDLSKKLEEIQDMSAEKGEHDEEPVMAASSEVEEAMKTMPDEVAKSIAKLAKPTQVLFAKAFNAKVEEVNKAVAEIRKERDIRLDAEAIAKSRNTYKYVGMDHEKAAPSLRRLAEVDPELAKTVEEVLAATDAQMEESGILREAGTSSVEPVSVIDEARSMAKLLVENGACKTLEQGIEKVLDENPELAKRYYAKKGRN
jgi:hypothetical protein